MKNGERKKVKRLAQLVKALPYVEPIVRQKIKSWVLWGVAP